MQLSNGSFHEEREWTMRPPLLITAILQSVLNCVISGAEIHVHIFL